MDVLTPQLDNSYEGSLLDFSKEYMDVKELCTRDCPENSSDAPTEDSITDAEIKEVDCQSFIETSKQVDDDESSLNVVESKACKDDETAMLTKAKDNGLRIEEFENKVCA